jgi:hypothetical protein
VSKSSNWSDHLLRVLIGPNTMQLYCGLAAPLKCRVEVKGDCTKVQLLDKQDWAGID